MWNIGQILYSDIGYILKRLLLPVPTDSKSTLLDVSYILPIANHMTRIVKLLPISSADSILLHRTPTFLVSFEPLLSKPIFVPVAVLKIVVILTSAKRLTLILVKNACLFTTNRFFVLLTLIFALISISNALSFIFDFVSALGESLRNEAFSVTSVQIGLIVLPTDWLVS